MSDEQKSGVVRWFSAPHGYGFIDLNGQDIYVHHTDIVMEGYRTLEDGQDVTFRLENGPRGLIAKCVVPS